MVRGGETPQDYRSEAERIGARPDAPEFNAEYHRGDRAARRVELKRVTSFQEAESEDAFQERIWSDQVIKQKVSMR
jgi:hypothetical protein